MRSIAFDHIALALPRMAGAVPFLAGVLGGAPHSGARGGPDFRFGTWRYDSGGKIEVIEPIGPTASSIASSPHAAPASTT